MNSWILTSAFCKKKMLEECLKHLSRNPEMREGFKHVVIDPHYPGVDSRDTQGTASRYGCLYLDALYDRGLHRGLNYALRVLDVQEEDIVIVCDPDDRPSLGSFHAMRGVMQSDPLVAVCGLTFEVLNWKQTQTGQWPEAVIGGQRVWVHPNVEMFNVSAFNTRFLKRLGGFSQPHAYYGGIESSLYEAWKKEGMKLVYLRDFTSEASSVDRSNPELYDQTYDQWKKAHVGEGFSGSYEEWLRLHSPSSSIS